MKFYNLSKVKISHMISIQTLAIILFVFGKPTTIFIETSSQSALGIGNGMYNPVFWQLLLGREKSPSFGRERSHFLLGEREVTFFSMSSNSFQFQMSMPNLCLIPIKMMPFFCVTFYIFHVIASLLGITFSSLVGQRC